MIWCRRYDVTAHEDLPPTAAPWPRDLQLDPGGPEGDDDEGFSGDGPGRAPPIGEDVCGQPPDKRQ